MLQFLSRIFGTAEMLLAIVVISEELGAESRGWGIGAFFAIQACGVGLVSILLPIASSFPNGWRGLYLVGLGPLLLLAWLRRSLPETPRFEARQRALAEQHAHEGYLAPMRRLIRAYPRRFTALSLQLFFGAVGYSAADFLGPKYLQEATRLDAGPDEHDVPGRRAARDLRRAGRRARSATASAAGPPRSSPPLLVVCSRSRFYNAGGDVARSRCGLARSSAVAGCDAVLSAYGGELFPTSHRSTAAAARLIVATLWPASLGLLLESVLYGVTGSHWHAVSLLLLVAFGAPRRDRDRVPGDRGQEPRRDLARTRRTR